MAVKKIVMCDYCEVWEEKKTISKLTIKHPGAKQVTNDICGECLNKKGIGTVISVTETDQPAVRPRTPEKNK